MVETLVIRPIRGGRIGISAAIRNSQRRNLADTAAASPIELGGRWPYGASFGKVREPQMYRRTLLIGIAAAVLQSCARVPEGAIGPDGLPIQQVYRITEEDAAEIPFRVLDALNTLRTASGAGPLVLNAELNAAAATHSRDMAIQNRPWHFGSDGSSPIDRLRRVGYTGQLVGEVISETFETEIETLAAWMQQTDTREILLSPAATRMGIAWFQEEGGKIWWTVVLAN